MRENVWLGRTAPTVHWSDGAVPMRFTMTSKPCARSWLTAVSTDSEREGRR